MKTIKVGAGVYEIYQTIKGRELVFLIEQDDDEWVYESFDVDKDGAYSTLDEGEYRGCTSTKKEAVRQIEELDQQG